MNRKLAITLTFAGMILYTSCTEVNPLISDENLIVVWAYLYAGETATNIKLNSTIRLDDNTAYAPPINDASVALLKDGVRYECVSSPGDSGYYHYPGDDLTIETGDEFTLDIEHADHFISAKTVVPEMPLNFTVTSNTMEVPDFSNPQGLRGWRENAQPIEISWENDDDSWYYVTFENIDDNPVEFNTWFSERLQDFIFPPLNDDSFMIRLPFITHLGMHRITVYKVNQEYVDLYESREQDSRDLNEPLTNVEGGLGVFSAFNSSSVFLNVVQSN